MSIVKKVFGITLSLFVIALLIQLFFQVFLLDEMYGFFKRIEIEQLMDEFVKEQNHLDERTLDYYENEDLPVLVVKDLEIENSRFIEMMNYIVLEEAGIEYKVLIGDRVDERGVLDPSFGDLELNETTSISGMKLKGTNIIIMDANIASPMFDALISISGTVIEHHFIERENVLDYQAEKLLREVSNILLEGGLEEGSFNFIEVESGLTIHIVIRSYEEAYAVGLYTIEDFSNTFEVLNNFYIYLFIFQVILLIAVTFVYTKWFTKPLVSLNEEAKRISRLDFSQNSCIKTGDELEELSNSLGMISESMSENIEMLKSEAKVKSENEERMRSLLANLSHEFKTPLGIMSGFLEMLEVSDDNKIYYINTISEEIERLNLLTKETLLLCESESQTDLSLEIMTTDQILVLDKFEIQAREKGLKWYEDIENHEVHGHLRKLQIVLYNLMSNAIKYSDVNETIKIVTKDQGEYVRIQVENTGLTLNDDEMEHIWDMYYRRSSSRGKSTSGNGLGLSIVKGILEAHKCQYGVYNGDNSLIFYFDLKKAEMDT